MAYDTFETIQRFWQRFAREELEGLSPAERQRVAAELETRFGRLMGFLFVWQFVLSGPLEIASGYIGFAQYAQYLWSGLGGQALSCLKVEEYGTLRSPS